MVAKAGEIVYVSSDSAHVDADPLRNLTRGRPSSPRHWPSLHRTDPRRHHSGRRPSGSTWRAVTGGSPTALTKPRDGWISDLLVDPESSQRHWATFSNPGAVFRSDDAGASWSDVTANLPFASCERDRQRPVRFGAGLGGV